MKFGLSTYLPILVYIGVVVTYFVMIFYKREFGLYFIAMILPIQVLLEKIQMFPLGKDIVDIYLLTLLVLSLLSPQDKNEGKIEFLNPIKAVVFYILATYVYLWIGSFINGVELPISFEDERFRNWKNHMILPVLFIITVKIIHTRRQIYQLLSVIIASMFFISLHFYRNFGHTSGHFREERRWSGAFTYLGPNEIGAFWAEYSFIIIGILFVTSLGILKWPLLLTLGLNIYSMLFTFSRGAYAAFIVALCFVSIVSKKFSALACLFVILLFWTSFVPESVVERVNMTKEEGGNLESSVEGRFGRWEHGLNLFLKNPLGYGFESVKYLGFRGSSGMLSSQGDPHNRYVEFLVEMGILGIALFLYLFYLAFKSGWRLYVDSEDQLFKGIGLGFAATVIACMVVNIFGDRWTYVMLGAFYWLLWGIVVKAYRIVQLEKTENMKDSIALANR